MGYLDEFGVKETQQERRRKRRLLTAMVILAVVGSLYYEFKNFREEARVKEFLAVLQRADYPAAYAFWGCKVEAPCPNYDFKSFQEDWGPNPPSKISKVRSYRLGTSHARGSGVIVPVVINDGPAIQLWVEKSNQTLGFAPPL
ncbi:MAG: hypothetical protein HY238_18370 [Acidobacteria bacterium]|nr:hypothetical protein [Acidobacteriota bacterium]